MATYPQVYFHTKRAYDMFSYNKKINLNFNLLFKAIYFMVLAMYLLSVDPSIKTENI